jgi:DNA-binding NtrC family response regulator
MQRIRHAHKKISDAALEALKALPWTGNIRELRNMVERLIILSDKTITDADVKAFANPSSPRLPPWPLRLRLKQILTSLPTSRNIRILPSANTSNSSSKKTTGTYLKLPTISIYSVVTSIVK